jgi:Fe2+ transport system protein FeoA
MLRGVSEVPRTLATLAPGESGRIRTFLYGSLRGLLSDMGIHEGETVRCRAGTGGVLVLDTEHGQTVSLARDWARFIEVGPADGEPAEH